jgi:hypothetical protein
LGSALSGVQRFGRSSAEDDVIQLSVHSQKPASQHCFTHQGYYQSTSGWKKFEWPSLVLRFCTAAAGRTS